MAARTEIKPRRARKQDADSRAPTAAEQRKLVDEFRASPRSRIRDPWDPAQLRVKDQLYVQMADPSLTSAERAAAGDAIEELGGDSTITSRVNPRTPGTPRRIEFGSSPSAHQTSATRSGNIRVAPRAPTAAAGTGEGDGDSFSGDPAFGTSEDEDKAKLIAALSAREASLAKLVTAAPASALKDIAGDVSKSTAATQTGMDALASASSKLNGASPDERIQLLQELQRSPELQDLVKAGLMNWDDMLVKNPPAGSDNHVSNPAGDDPAYVIDSKKLADLRRKLAAYGAKQTATLQNVQQAVARRRTTPGSVPSAQDAIFPGVKVWTPVAWAPAPRPGA
jgi:hypothetical protein